MKVSIVLILEYLKKWNPKIVGKNSLKKRSFINSMIFFEGMDTVNEYILIGKGESFNKIKDLKEQGIICTGSPSENIIENNICIILDKEAELTMVYQNLQEMFLKYTRWDEKLKKAVYRGDTLEELCTIGFEVFNNSLFIHDQNSEILASVFEMEGQFKWEQNPVTGKKILPISILNEFKVSDEYHKTMQTNGANIFSKEQFGYRIMYINLWRGSEYLGRICVNEISRKFTKGDYQLLEFFAEIILFCLNQGDKIYKKNMYYGLQQVLTELLDENNKNEQNIKERLESFGWKIDDKFFCISIFLEKRDNKIYTIEYYCNFLAQMYQFAAVFLYREHILLVFNKNISNMTDADIFQKFAIFLREGLFKAGVSSVGKNLQYLKYYFMQTEIAYNIGMKNDPMFWMYRFNDYIIDYILNQATKKMQPFMLYESHLMELYQYDKKHNTGLFETLRIYLEFERNAVHASNYLYIHRSTFLYRLKKIKSIIKVDLGDSDVRLHLMLTYKLFDSNSKDI